MSGASSSPATRAPVPQAEPDYALADRLGAGGMVFFPRRDDSPAPPGAFDHAIEVAPGVVLGARLYLVGAGAPTILYFHGNGEVVSDHDDVAELYREVGVNLFVVAFRGYGRSTGRPAFASLVSDAGPVVERFHAILDAQQFSGMRLVMGRSLGTQTALEVAANHALGLTQAALRFTGHAIEIRVNAEDPSNNFRPAPGTLGAFDFPRNLGPGTIRVDTHMHAGDAISPYYDSLIAKVIAHAPTRDAAIETLLRCLRASKVSGVATTIPLHLRVLDSAEFRSGVYDTRAIPGWKLHPIAT